MQDYNIQLYDILVYDDINQGNVNYYFIFDKAEENYSKKIKDIKQLLQYLFLFYFLFLHSL